MDAARTKYVFIIVGAGGTGSLLARDIPKLIIDTDHKMLIVDGDHVEEKNMKRQSYQKQDIGEYKAVALSSKINTFYETNCDALGMYLTKDEIFEYCENNFMYIPVIIGCVDNDATRKILEATFNKLDWCYYFDSANGEYEGNIYICKKLDGIKRGVLRSGVYELSKDIHPLDESCEVQAAKGNVQYLVTNAKMSIYLLEHCNALLNMELKVGVQNVKRFSSIFYED